MFNSVYKNPLKLNQIVRNASKSYGALKVALCGAAGNSGQAVALLLKSCPLIDELALYDVKTTSGIAMELNHIDTKCQVFSYKRDKKNALKHSHVVAIIASTPNVTPGSGHNFQSNAEIVSELVTSVAEYCPKALIAIATNPVNSMVPLATEIMKHYGVYNPNHIFGITTLDVMRTNSLVAQKLGIAPENVHVPCIGGHEKLTAVPILSATKPKTDFRDEELLSITEAVQNSQSRLGDDECSNSFLSGALATAQFIISLVRGIKGEDNVIETCFVKSKVYPQMDYLATPVVIGTDGILKNLGIPYMSDYEKCLFQTCREVLHEEIHRGEQYIRSKYSQTCT